MSVPAQIVWKSNLQGLVLAYKKKNLTMKMVDTLKSAVNYVHMGGCLEDCFTTIGELLMLTCFSEEDVLGVEEVEQLLLAVLCSSEIKRNEAVTLFDEDMIRNIMGRFQTHCCITERTKFWIEKKNLWKSILRETYYAFYHHRPFMYRTIVEYFKYIASIGKPKINFRSNVVTEVDTKVIAGFYGVAELLEVVAAIIEGFKTPLNPQHIKEILYGALLPLHNNTLGSGECGCSLAIYHRQLAFCMTQFIEKDNSLLPELASRVCNIIQKMISAGHSKPAVYLINETEMLVEKLSKSSFDTVKVPFFGMIKLATESLHFMIAQRVFLLLLTPSIYDICENFSVYFENNVIPILLRVCQSHWNDSTKQMSFQVLAKWNRRSSSSLKHSHTFQTISESYTERWQSETEAEERKAREMLKPKTNLSFTKFVFVSKMGEGSYSQVHHVRRIDNKVSQAYWEDYALKVMEMHQLTEQNYEANVALEIKLLKHVLNKHPNIIKLIGDFKEDRKQFMVLEYAARGDLFSVLERLGTLDEDYARFTISQVCSAMKGVHEKRILHLDVKPENILVSQSGFMKLTDFGAAIELDNMPSVYQLQGTAEYLSPSLIYGALPTPGDDIWAIGCTLYQLLAGTTPFNDTNKEELFRKICERKLIFPLTFPTDAKDLVNNILCIGKESYVPITLEEVMNHAYFTSTKWDLVNEGVAPTPLEGKIKVSEIDVNLRQRKNSMLLTQSLPRKYQYSSFSLEPIPESPTITNMNYE